MARGTIDFQKIPEGHGMPLFPFAPMIYYQKLPMSLVRSLNKYTNKVIKDEKSLKN